MKLLKFFSLYLLLNAGFAAAETPVTLCAANEKIIFSCSLKHNKTVSLCSSTQLSATTGYLQYRFGKINHAPELEFPQEKLPPYKFFRLLYLPMGKASGLTNIAFDLNDYVYTIDQYGDDRDENNNDSGVTVKKQDKIISYLSCNKNSEIGGLGELIHMDIQLKEIESDQMLQGGILINN